jgi:hypothetical protein
VDATAVPRKVTVARRAAEVHTAMVAHGHDRVEAIGALDIGICLVGEAGVLKTGPEATERLASPMSNSAFG